MFCAKSQYELKLASASAPSSISCSKNFDNIRDALVVGCFVTVKVIEAKAEKAVDFTCIKSAVGGLRCHSSELGNEAAFFYLWWRQYHRLQFTVKYHKYDLIK